LPSGSTAETPKAAAQLPLRNPVLLVQTLKLEFAGCLDTQFTNGIIRLTSVRVPPSPGRLSFKPANYLFSVLKRSVTVPGSQAASSAWQQDSRQRQIE